MTHIDWDEIEQMRERLRALSKRLEAIQLKHQWRYAQLGRKMSARLDGIEQDDTCIGCGRTELYCECAQFDSERK